MLGCSVVSFSLWPQAPLFMGFPRHKYWSGLPFPSPGDLRNPGIKPISPTSPALAGDFLTSAPLVMYWILGKLGKTHFNQEYLLVGCVWPTSYLVTSLCQKEKTRWVLEFSFTKQPGWGVCSHYTLENPSNAALTLWGLIAESTESEWGVLVMWWGVWQEESS